MKTIISGILIMFFLATAGYGQESAQPQPLTLTIYSDKQVYEAGEKINIRYELENLGKDVLQINKILVPGGDLMFEVESERTRIPLEGPSTLFFAAYWHQLGDSGIISLSANEKIIGTYSIDLISFLGWKDIPHNMLEGNYKIRVYLQVYAKSEENKLQQLLVQLTSNTITIEVGEKRKESSVSLNDEMDCAQIAKIPSNNNLELKNGYEYGLAERDPSLAFSLANGFIQREKDLRRFLITEPSVRGNNGVYDVRYKLLTKSEESEAIVRVDIRNKRCKRIK